MKKRGAFVSVKSSAKLKPEDVDHLKVLIEEGRLKAIIDRRWALGDIAAAHEYVEKGHKKGNVAIIVTDEA